MIFKINPSNGTPVYEQVVNQVVSAIASGILEKGEMIPSVRQLSKDLAINPNTVARAYRQLQDTGIVNSIRGSGLQVASGAKKKCQSKRKQTVSNRIQEAIREASESRLPMDEILEIVQAELKKLNRKKG